MPFGLLRDHIEVIEGLSKPLDFKYMEPIKVLFLFTRLC